nr:hypothetical protein [Azospirillum sp. 412522]
MPKWLYNKMIAGYTPMVPTLGTMSTIGAACALLGGGLAIRVIQKRHAGAQG